VAEVLGIVDQTSLGLIEVLRDRNKRVAEAAARSQAPRARTGTPQP
jgi:hypothetical protein